MSLITLVVLLVAVPLVSCGTLSAQFTKSTAHYGTGPSGRVRADPGEPLFLTPYILAGKIDEGRTAFYAGGLGRLD